MAASKTDSRFVVLPPTGPQARLHLVVDGTIRPVLVQHVTPESLAGTPDLDNLLDRVNPAHSS